MKHVCFRLNSRLFAKVNSANKVKTYNMSSFVYSVGQQIKHRWLWGIFVALQCNCPTVTNTKLAAVSLCETGIMFWVLFALHFPDSRESGVARAVHADCCAVSDCNRIIYITMVEYIQWPCSRVCSAGFSSLLHWFLLARPPLWENAVRPGSAGCSLHNRLPGVCVCVCLADALS